MRPTFWARVREAVCRWVGHRERFSEVGQCVSCRRCRLLLRGPLNLTAKDRARLAPSTEQTGGA